MSPTATLSKMEEFGANFDQKVVSWIETMSTKLEVMKDTECEIVSYALALITYSCHIGIPDVQFIGDNVDLT